MTFDTLTEGEIIDVTFPQVDPTLSATGVADLAKSWIETIIGAHGPDNVVHVMGETGFVFAFVTAAKARGLSCVHSTTERIAVETKNADGTVTKTATFKFVQFRSF
jgi:hypothetical protein